MRTDHAAGPASSGGYLRAAGEPPGYDTASIIPRLRLTIPGPASAALLWARPDSPSATAITVSTVPEAGPPLSTSAINGCRRRQTDLQCSGRLASHSEGRMAWLRRRPRAARDPYAPLRLRSSDLLDSGNG
jgi:hypothetical protein